ncbi:MAG: hypothetical protein QW334_01185 [Thermofilum sp.]
MDHSALKDFLKSLKEHTGELYLGDGTRVEGEEKIKIENTLYQLLMHSIQTETLRAVKPGHPSWDAHLN